jgi:actin-related protein 6
MKEDVCFVAQNFRTVLKEAQQPYFTNPHVLEYVLPDYINVMRGFVKCVGCASSSSKAADLYFNRPREDGENAPKKRRTEAGADEAVLLLANERFRVPEMLFTPSDVGLGEQGVAELVVDAIQACPPG